VSTLQGGSGYYPEWPEFIPCPPDGEETCHAIFNGILSVRAASDWNDGDAILAAEFAAATCRLAQITRAADLQGPVITKPGRKGQDTFVKNPAFEVISSLGARQLQLARSLGFSGLPSSTKSVVNQAAKLGGEFVTKTKKPEGEAPDWSALAKEEES